MAKPIFFGVLGPLVVERAGKDLTPEGAREQTLVAALAMRVGEVVAVPELMEILWGDQPPRSGSKAVQGAVSRARAELGRWKDVIARADGGYTLAVSREHVDAGRFMALVEQARDALEDLDAVEAVRLLREALAQWRAAEPFDLGEGIAARAAVRELTEARLAAIEDLFEAALATGEHASLVGEIERALARHPHRERLWGHLMLALYRSGRRADALEAFERMRARFAAEVGLDPSPDLRELHERIRAQDPTLELPAASPTVDLPEEPTPFVGREPEIDAVASLLAQPGLVTITGIGGVGKTRFALHIARTVHARFEGRVAWRGARARLPALDPGLLVVDGCDERARDAIRDLIARHPDACVLATAERALGIEGERIVRLDPMVIGIGGPSPAVRLFVDRARESDPWFDASDERSIADLCARVGGLPLAIELVATCAASMKPAEVLARLRERFPGALEVRLDDLLTWLWDRLSASEQRALMTAALFEGAFSPEVIECACPGVAGVIEPLAGRALLRRDGDRLRLPGALRAFMLAQLASSGDEEAARARYASALAEHVERLGEVVVGAHEAAAVREIDASFDDLRVAFTYALSRRDADVGLRIVHALRWLAFFRGVEEVLEWARAAGTTFAPSGHALVGEVLGLAGLLDPPLIARAMAVPAVVDVEASQRTAPVMATFADAVVATREHDHVRALARADALVATDDPVAARYARAARIGSLLALGQRDEALRAMNAYRLAVTRIACPSLRAVALESFADVVRADDPDAAAAMEQEARALASAVGNVLVARAPARA